MENKIFKYLKFFYIFVLCIFYVWIELNYIKLKTAEVGISLILIMMILTGPLGIIIPLFLSIAGRRYSFAQLDFWGTDHLFMFLLWIGMSALGYIQWFIILPKQVKRFKKWRFFKN
jgi:hypothetical protein